VLAANPVEDVVAKTAATGNATRGRAFRTVTADQVIAESRNPRESAMLSTVSKPSSARHRATGESRIHPKVSTSPRSPWRC